MAPRSRPHYVGVYKTWPKRYFTGLTPSQKIQREKELMTRRTSLGKTDLLAKPRKSQWTQMFHAISTRTGIPRSTLDTVYNRGLKAWQTSGSRVGANPQQWATARVYKFVLVTKNKVPTTRIDPDKNLR